MIEGSAPATRVYECSTGRTVSSRVSNRPGPFLSSLRMQQPQGAAEARGGIHEGERPLLFPPSSSAESALAATPVILPVGKGISFGRLKQYNKVREFAAPQTQPGTALGAQQLQIHPLGSSTHEVRRPAALCSVLEPSPSSAMACSLVSSLVSTPFSAPSPSFPHHQQEIDDGTAVPVLAVAGLPGDELQPGDFSSWSSAVAGAYGDRLLSSGSLSSGGGSDGCLAARGGGEGVLVPGGTLASTILRVLGGRRAGSARGRQRWFGGRRGIHGCALSSRGERVCCDAEQRPCDYAPRAEQSSRASNGGSETQRGGVGGHLSAPRPDPGVLKRKRPDMEQGVLILGTGGHFAAKGSSKAPALGDRGVAVRSANSK